MGILIIIGKVLITVLIVILSLFLLVLLLAGLVLFVPVKYKAAAEQEPAAEGEGHFTDNLSVKGIISWCLFLARISFSYENGGSKYSIRILGIDIKKLREKFPKKFSKKRKIKKSKKRKPAGKKLDKSGKNTENKDERKIEKDTAVQDGKKEDIKAEDKKAENADGKDADASDNKKGFFARIFNKLAVIWKNIKKFIDKIRKLPSIIREKKKKAEDFIELLKTDMVKESICVVWENVVHLWSKLKPRKVSGKLHFGTSDPCLTGRILGGLAVFMGMTGMYIEVTPDFEEKVFEGRIEIKGRLQFVTLLKIIVRLYRDENIKEAAKQFNLF